ncbi:MAG TPA: sodium:solute symporter family protein [Saprospiraceae bacterium]|nr:sodium:solute symporter family protein [Saprospiraceae bacterium]HMQ85081.1 sodium:solute symporter family protein [Saprospiraceae bacterium]
MLLTFIVLYLCITLLIGWWASRRVHTTKDFVIAGRNLPMILAASALFATWFGSETIMGASSEFVENGFLGVIEDPFGAALCLILVGAFFARPLYKMNILTFNDFFRLRFSRKAEFISAIFMIPSYFGWIAAQMVAMGVILSSITGISELQGIALCALVVVIYTYIGGMWAISITDFVQTIMIIVGLLILAIQLGQKAGGFQAVLASTPEGFFRFFPDRDFHSIIHYIAAWITIGLGSIPQQDVFQRVMAAKSAKTAVQASYVSGLMYLSIGMIPLFIGLCGRILYPELSENGDGQNIIPQMVLSHSSLLMQIMFFGALLSAILSTTSGAVLAPATVIGENLIRPYFPKLDDKQLLRIMRLSVVGVALLSAIMAGYTRNIYELVGQSSALSLVALFVPLTAGLYWKKASDLGTLMAIVVGTVVWLFCEIQATAIPSLIYGGVASLVAMLLGSWLWPDKSYERFVNNQVNLSDL